MDDDVVIKVENLSKQYRLGVIGHGTLSQDLQSWWARFRGKEDPNAKVDAVSSHYNRFSDERFWALKDISFEVRKGEILGIIGRNGAGKSTLLKILSRVTAPTSGSVKIKGRVASLLEVGTGFHPELTGRENVFLNGAILGMTKREIESKFDEIVQFAEIEKFIDTPVKRYSSGMYVRLAFAVAAHLEPEILIVDEVLAVGDSSFQKKCLGKMGEVAGEGRTVLFVSHNMGVISKLCSRSILLKDGILAFDGITDQTINIYFSEEEILNKEFIQPHSFNKKLNIRRVCLLTQENEVSSVFRYDEEIKISIEFEVNSPTPCCCIWTGIRTLDGSVAFDTSDVDMDEKLLETTRPIGYYKTLIKLPSKWLNAGDYLLVAGIVSYNPLTSHDRVEALKFSIKDIGTPSKIRTGFNRPGILQPYIQWEYK